MPPRQTESACQIVLGTQTVGYLLRRSARRTIGLRIDQRGLCVGAPVRAAQRDIDALLHRHADWILDKLRAWRERPAASVPEIADGSTIFLLGEAWTARLSPGGRNTWRAEARTLHLAPATPEHTLPLLNRALRELARRDLAERLQRHAARFAVATPPLRLSSARTRWGSCNARGHIALNWKLILLPPAVVDYVVCHELAHLKEMNHSPRFWSVVETLCPDWRTQRNELRRLGRQLPNF